jgi:hypothetical protein
MAFTTTSGPMPQGSPMVIAIAGFAEFSAVDMTFSFSPCWGGADSNQSCYLTNIVEFCLVM